jgi:hypothetical protein
MYWYKSWWSSCSGAEKTGAEQSQTPPNYLCFSFPWTNRLSVNLKRSSAPKLECSKKIYTINHSYSIIYILWWLHYMKQHDAEGKRGNTHLRSGQYLPIILVPRSSMFQSHFNPRPMGHKRQCRTNLRGLTNKYAEASTGSGSIHLFILKHPSSPDRISPALPVSRSLMGSWCLLRTMCAPPATRKTACRGIPVHSIPQASISQRVENRCLWLWVRWSRFSKHYRW